MKAFAASALLLIAIFQPLAALAHALDPGYLELSRFGEDRWRVTWRVPDVSGRPMPLEVRLPEGCEANPAPDLTYDGRAWSTAYVATCANGLAGGTIRIAGLERSRTDTLVRYELTAGQSQTHRLTPGAPGFTVPLDSGRGEILASYIPLGISHILEGIDHLLFVLCLVLLIHKPGRLFWAVTAFTLAHSITLAAASLGVLRIPSPPVEAVIALSIVFLAYELTLPPERRDPLTMHFPWLVSFAFGLVHGLGFAGALREIGLPEGDIPLALFSFNVGVELGQLLFVLAVLAARTLATRLLPDLARKQALVFRASGYAVGSVAAFWVIERMAAF